MPDTISALRLSSKSRILVIRRDNVGDLVCTTPLLAALKEWSGGQVAVLVSGYNAEVLHLNPNVNQVFVYSDKKSNDGVLERYWKRARLMLEIRRWRPDVVILAKSGYDHHGLKYARRIGCRLVVGYAPPIESNQPQPDVSIPSFDFSSLHEVMCLEKLLEPFGYDAQLRSLRVVPDPQVRRRIAATLTNLETAATKIAVHISARDPERQWGQNHWIELINYLIHRLEPAAVVMLFWMPGTGRAQESPSGDDQLAEEIISRINHPNLNAVPVFSVSELIAGLSLADLFVGADGGALHIAAGLAKPIVGLYERLATKVNHWYPWKVKNQIVITETDVISSIPTDKVIKAVKSLLDHQTTIGNPL